MLSVIKNYTITTISKAMPSNLEELPVASPPPYKVPECTLKPENH